MSESNAKQIFPCPSCGKKYDITGLTRALRIKCRRCGKPFEIAKEQLPETHDFPVGAPPKEPEGGLVVQPVTGKPADGEFLLCRSCSKLLDVSGIPADLQIKCGACKTVQAIPDSKPEMTVSASPEADEEEEEELTLELKAAVHCPGCDAQWYLDELDPPVDGHYVCERCGRLVPDPKAKKKKRRRSRTSAQRKKKRESSQKPKRKRKKKKRRKKKRSRPPTADEVQKTLQDLSTSDRQAATTLLSEGEVDRAILLLYPLTGHDMDLARAVVRELEEGRESLPRTPEAPAGEASEEIGFFDSLARKGRLVRFNMLYKLGSWEKLAEVGERIRDAEPENPRVRFQLGEAYRELDRPAEAVDEFKAVTEQTPDEVRAWRQLADCHIELDELEKGAAALERLAELRPDDPEPLEELKAVYRELGRAKDALSVLERLTNRYPERLALREEAIQLLLDEGAIDRALEALGTLRELEGPPFNRTTAWVRRIRDQQPDVAGTYELEVDLELAMERPLRAIKALLELVRREPDRSEFWERLGRLYLDEGMQRGALRAFEKAGPLDDLPPDLLFRLAEALVRLGDAERAEELLKTGEKQEPERFARRRIQLLLETDRPREAIEELAERTGPDGEPIPWVASLREKAREMALDNRIAALEEEEEPDAATRVELASAYLERNSLEKALRALQMIDEADDRRDEVLTVLRALIAQGVPESAVHEVRDLLLEMDERQLAISFLEQHGRRETDLLLELGRLYLEEGAREKAAATLLALGETEDRHLDEVIDLAERVLETTEELPSLHRCLALARLRTEDTAGAIESFRAYLQHVPEDAASRELLAESLCEMGESDAALEEYETLFEIGPASTEALLAYGSLLTEADRLPEAAQTYREALRHNPDHVELRRRLGEVEDRILDREIAALKEELEESPDDTLLRDRLIRRLVRGRYDDEEAINELASTLPNLETPATTFYRVAVDFLKQHRKHRLAIDYARRLLDVEPIREDPEAENEVWYEIGTLCERIRDLVAAKKAFLRIFEMDAEFRDVLDRLEALERGEIHTTRTEPFIRAVNLADLSEAISEPFAPLEDIRLDHIDLSWEEIFVEEDAEPATPPPLPPAAASEVGPPLPLGLPDSQTGHSLSDRKTEKFRLDDLGPIPSEKDRFLDTDEY